VSISLTAEQDEFVSALRAAFAKASPIEAVLSAAEEPCTRSDANSWAVAVAMGVPELGALADGTLLDLALAVEEAAYAVLPGTVLAHGLAVRLAGRCSEAPFVADLTSGRRRASICVERQHTMLSARRSGDGWVLAGSLSFVLEGHTADLLLVRADGPDGPLVLALTDLGDAVQPVDTFDPSRGWARVGLDAVTVPDSAVLATGDVAARALDTTLVEGAVLVAFDAAGSSRRTLDDAIEYARQREQFGRPIGSFQAVKHLLVDAHVAVDELQAASRYAAWAVDVDASDVGFAVHAAKALAGQIHPSVAATAVQVLGGIGFTRELPAHLHVKRAQVDDRMFGSAAEHRRGVLATFGEVRDSWSAAAGAHDKGN
jgi:alkylation response protein AidB-like acyl-CoA dehydrogenase